MIVEAKPNRHSCLCPSCLSLFYWIFYVLFWCLSPFSVLKMHELHGRELADLSRSPGSANRDLVSCL